MQSCIVKASSPRIFACRTTLTTWSLYIGACVGGTREASAAVSVGLCYSSTHAPTPPSVSYPLLTTVSVCCFPRFLDCALGFKRRGSALLYGGRHRESMCLFLLVGSHRSERAPTFGSVADAALANRLPIAMILRHMPSPNSICVQFNRSLRLKANKMGYSLNQRGLYANVIRNKERQKVTDGKFPLFVFTASSLSSWATRKRTLLWRALRRRGDDCSMLITACA